MKITIPIAPTGQMRARHGVINGFSRTYKAKEQESREATIKTFLLPHRPPVPMDGPLYLGVKAYLPIPKSWNKARKNAALKGLERPITKPDLDNAIKNIQDCLTDMGFWTDDKLVVGYLPHTGKYYSDSPRWEIEIVEFRP